MALPCDIPQTRLEDFPLAAVDHHRDRRGNIIPGDQTQVTRHRLGAVQKCVVKVDVDDRSRRFELVRERLRPLRHSFHHESDARTYGCQ